MDRRHFIGGLIAAGSLAAIESAEASPLVKLASKAKKVSRKKFDEELVVLISDLHSNPEGYQPGKLKIVIEQILSMKPLPANVIALGDLAYLTGQESEYAALKEVLSPIEAAGIKLTLAMGNHDRRENFGKVFPDHAARTLVEGRYVSIVETPNADIIVLDSLQQGEDTTKWITPGAIDDAQREWLEKTLAGYKKPVFVSSHHPMAEVKLNSILLDSPTCCGYIHGHDHRWRLDWFKRNYREERMIRTLCMPSTGHWGDIGFVAFQLGKDKAQATLHENEFFFPFPAEDPSKAPEQWKMISDEQDGNTCTFSYKV